LAASGTTSVVDDMRDDLPEWTNAFLLAKRFASEARAHGPWHPHRGRSGSINIGAWCGD
jgi:hypothetical protein